MALGVKTFVATEGDPIYIDDALEMIRNCFSTGNFDVSIHGDKNSVTIWWVDSQGVAETKKIEELIEAGKYDQAKTQINYMRRVYGEHMQLDILWARMNVYEMIGRKKNKRE